MDEARIPDPFYNHLIVMYRARAVYWRNISISLLLATFAFILGGIVLFYRGDSRSIAAKQEVEIKSELKAIREKIREKLSAVDDLESQLTVAQEAKKLADQFGSIIETLTELQKESEPADAAGEAALTNKLQDLRQITKRVRVILENAFKLSDAANEEAALAPVPLGADGLRRFSKDSFRLLTDSEVQVDWSATVDELNLFGPGLETVSVATIKEDFRKLKEATDRCLRTDSAFAKLNLLQSTIGETLNAISIKLETERSDFRGRQQAVTMLGQEEEELNQQLEEIVGDRNYVLFMAWIPDLTIRVGAVILLLFITKILLVTYRYTASLSSYCLGIADAIQLLQPGTAGAGWYKIEHFTSLLTNLIPSGLSIESVNTPAENLTDLAKAWISKKA
ncbi:MAG: hypothetical protein SFV81_06420 [Pirellulaceae bacterium]|nr:hypothetical protein [Pirellulaceae bacterium]